MLMNKHTIKKLYGQDRENLVADYEERKYWIEEEYQRRLIQANEWRAEALRELDFRKFHNSKVLYDKWHKIAPWLFKLFR